MSTRKAIDGRAVFLMVCLCMTWGGQQVVLKGAAADIAPVLHLALRSGIAAILVFGFMRLRGGRIALAEGHWRPGLLVGLFFALEFLLVGEGLRHTTASHMVVFLYTAPAFAALGLHWKLPAERLTFVQWGGLALAFGGIAVAFMVRSPALAGSVAAPANVLFGDFLGLLAGIFWAATTVTIRCSSLARASASETLLYQLVSAFVLLIAAAFLLGQTTFRNTPLAWGSLAFQSIIVSFVSFLIWFWLLRHYLASRLGVLSFMTPLFGVLFGVWLLREPLEPRFVAGAVMVLTGIFIVSGYGWLRSVFVRRAMSAG
jgi:drug/metabolite transporter (DMT)-like permease